MTQDRQHFDTAVFFSTKVAPVNGISRVKPKYGVAVGECAFYMNVGLFFDGTNNNMYRDRDDLSHTNVARLFDAYNDKDGSYRVYVPGVGTRFPQIGELTDRKLFGGALAWGCEERILFGLLSVLDRVHMRVFGDKNFMFTEDQLRVLCSRSSLNRAEADILLPLGIGQGLMTNDTPQALLKFLVSKLEQKLQEPTNKVKVCECMIDVFGFSRGAAEARVFCTWLNQILVDGKLAGVIVQLRFVGLFDTVASYGVVKDYFSHETRGHEGWAKPENLQLQPASAKYCVHMVAMHEFRKNFPLDTILIKGTLPEGAREFAYPGAHSDVGGGYKPGELGVGVGTTPAEGDALKLAQIPLNHMFDCAVAASVPLKKERAIDPETLHNPFTIHPKVEQAYASFLTHSGSAPKRLHEWAQPYLTWRWKVRNEYADLWQVKNALEVDEKGIKDKDLLTSSNQRFIRDAGFINRALKNSIENFSLGQKDAAAYKIKVTNADRNSDDDSSFQDVFDPEARRPQI